MSEPDQFVPGQTVYCKMSGAAYEFIAERSGRAFLFGKESELTLVVDVAGLTATDPNAKPLPQNCPFCGEKAIVFTIGSGEVMVYCGAGDAKGARPCLRGPYRENGEEAIAAWDSISVVAKNATTAENDADESAVTHDFRPPAKIVRTCLHCGQTLPIDQFAGNSSICQKCNLEILTSPPDDDAPLTEEWLRKVGLHDGSLGTSIYLRGNEQRVSMMDDAKTARVFFPAFCKTIGDARQLCRLLGVTIKEKA